MGWPKIEVSEATRCKLAKAAGALNIIAIPFCLVLLITGVYVLVAISSRLSLIEGLNGKVLPGFMIGAAILGLISCIFGGKACWVNHKPEKRKYWSKYLLPYVCVALFVFLCILVAAIVCFAQITTLEASFGKGISSAIRKYKLEPSTKQQLDELQIEFECCGSESYTDWFGVSWIHEEYLTKAMKIAAKNSRTGEYMSDDVPFSCCSPDILRPCIHNHVHDNSKHFNYDYRSKVTLYKRGCKVALTNLYGRKILAEVGGVVFFISVVQLVLVIISRILQTAIVSSVEADDPEASSIAYIFPVGRRAIKSVAKGIKKYHKGEQEEAKKTLPLLDEHGLEITDDDNVDGNISGDEAEPMVSPKTPEAPEQLDTDDFDNFSSFEDVSVEKKEEPIYENVPFRKETSLTSTRQSKTDNRYVPMPTMPPPSFVGSAHVQPRRSHSSGIYETIQSREMLQSNASIPDFPPPPPPSGSRITSASRFSNNIMVPPYGSLTGMPAPPYGSMTGMPVPSMGSRQSSVYISAGNGQPFVLNGAGLPHPPPGSRQSLGGSRRSLPHTS